MSISNEIKQRIDKLNEGEIIMTFDFTDLASISTVRKCLGRLVKEGSIRRIFDGVYEKPKFSELLNEYLPTSPERVAYAIAKNYHWNIAPSGDVALNKLGLTTQVPTTWIFVSDGPYREFNWGNTKLKFKHKTNREISQFSKQTELVVSALRTLGKENIDNNVINHLKKILSNEDKKIILNESKNCSEWIFETIRKVCIRNEECCNI